MVWCKSFVGSLLALMVIVTPLAKPVMAEDTLETGTVLVQVYKEPRRGRRIKITGQIVKLNSGQTTVTNKYGVAKFSKITKGSYSAQAGNYQSQTGELNRSVLRLQIIMK